jgi:hypothetical protein
MQAYNYVCAFFGKDFLSDFRELEYILKARPLTLQNDTKPCYHQFPHSTRVEEVLLVLHP